MKIKRKKVLIEEKVGGKKELLINIVIILVTAFFGISLIRNVVRVAKAKRQIVETAAEVTKLQKENQELKNRLTEVDSQNFTETQLRDKLGLAKPGETVLVLPDPEILKKLAPVDNVEQQTLPEPNWEKWYKLFF